MDITKITLDKIFIPLFNSLDDGQTIDIVELNFNFDYRQRSGPLTKGELEYLINYQIKNNNIAVVSETEFMKVSVTTSQITYVVSQEAIDYAAKEYSKQFWKIYNEISKT